MARLRTCFLELHAMGPCTKQGAPQEAPTPRMLGQHIALDFVANKTLGRRGQAEHSLLNLGQLTLQRWLASSCPRLQRSLIAGHQQRLLGIEIVRGDEPIVSCTLQLEEAIAASGHYVGATISDHDKMSVMTIMTLMNINNTN